MPQKPLNSEYEYSVVGWRPGSSPRGWLPVLLLDYHAYRGLKCEPTKPMPRRVHVKAKCGSSPAACGRTSVSVRFWRRHTQQICRADVSTIRIESTFHIVIRTARRNIACSNATLFLENRWKYFFFNFGDYKNRTFHGNRNIN